MFVAMWKAYLFLFILQSIANIACSLHFREYNLNYRISDRRPITYTSKGYIMKKPQSAVVAQSAIGAMVQQIAAATVAIKSPVAIKSSKPKNAASKPVIKAKKAVSAINAKFIVQDFARPKAGRQLFAFTQAWLELSGIINAKACDAKALRDIAGSTAIAYHTRNGNFQRDGNALSLSSKGLNFFSERMIANAYDPKDTDAFKQMMQTGKIDGNLIKNQSAIAKLSQ